MKRQASAPTPDDDADLVRRIAAAPADSAADEAELFRRFGPRVRVYGRRHLRDEHAAADLVQEVMATVIEAVRAGRVESPERIRQFILGTCRFTVWKIRRGASRQTETAERVGLELIADDDGGARHALDAEKLERCLAGLPTREQRVLYLSFCEDRTAPEIAAALSISEANVRVIRHRTLVQLRACVDRGGE